jgi:enterochelin esterase-like enzyme
MRRYLFLGANWLLVPMSFFERIFHTSHIVKVLEQEVHSTHLSRPVRLTVILPPDYGNPAFFFSHYRLLLLNDGQDFPALQLEQTLNHLYQHDRLKKIIVVGIHANHDRLYEYGTAHQVDFKNRGNKAGQHTNFVLTELLPYMEHQFRLKRGPENRVIAGFSLGGLSALDIAWNHPQVFAKVGVFSGSLWWRKKAFEDGYDDYNDRIMHVQVRQHTQKPSLKFWFQTGTEDEIADRNNNGVIDAIDDTLDLMTELNAKGFMQGVDYQYVEIQGGQHNFQTWSQVMPTFLLWAFGK